MRSKAQMRSKNCRFQKIFAYRNTELFLLFIILSPGPRVDPSETPKKKKFCLNDSGKTKFSIISLKFFVIKVPKMSYFSFITFAGISFD